MPSGCDRRWNLPGGWTREIGLPARGGEGFSWHPNWISPGQLLSMGLVADGTKRYEVAECSSRKSTPPRHCFCRPGLRGAHCRRSRRAGCMPHRGKELATVAETAVRHGYRGLISFGVAGGLASHLRAGDWVVASSVREAQTVRATDAVWSRKLLDSSTMPSMRRSSASTRRSPSRQKSGSCIGRPGPPWSTWNRTSSRASPPQHRLAFAAVRVVVDPAHRHGAAGRPLNMRPDGRPNVLGDVARYHGAAVAALAAGAHRRRCVRRPRRHEPRAAPARTAFRARRSRLSLRRRNNPPGPRFRALSRGRTGESSGLELAERALHLRDELRAQIGLQSFDAALAAVARFLDAAERRLRRRDRRSSSRRPCRTAARRRSCSRSAPNR